MEDSQDGKEDSEGQGTREEPSVVRGSIEPERAKRKEEHVGEP